MSELSRCLSSRRSKRSEREADGPRPVTGELRSYFVKVGGYLRHVTSQKNEGLKLSRGGSLESRTGEPLTQE